MTTPLYQLENAFLENADPTLHLVASKLRPSPKFVRFRMVDANGHEYWFIQKEQAKLAPAQTIGLATALMWDLYMRWRASFDQVEILIPTVVSKRTCDVTHVDTEHVYSDTFVVKSFYLNGYDASAIELRIPSYVGVWRNRDFDADKHLQFIRCLDQDGRILELTFHHEVEDYARGVVSVNTVMQEVAEGLHNSIGLLLRSMEYLDANDGERNTYTPVYLPAE